MRHANAVLEIIHDTGEPSAVNAARSVREGIDGKGPGNRNLAGDLLHLHVRFGGGPSEKALPKAGTSPAAYPTARPVLSQAQQCAWPTRQNSTCDLESP
jgi:hypothetical protein